jgi:hypothetical protein
MEVNSTSTTDPLYMYNNMNTLLLNPTIFVIVLVIIIVYLILFSSLGNNEKLNNNGDNSVSNIMVGIIITVLIILIVVNAFQYFFSISISAYIKDIFTNKPKIDIVVNQTDYKSSPVPEIRIKNQVYNIPGNNYTFTNAKALCTAYGSRLATYQELEDSYKNGAEWCNYGWSDGQMALYPTQQNTFENLQKIKGHEHDCGRPGINGGYMANPNLMFGVNCYGNKPKITPEEEENMRNTTPYPETMEDKIFQKRVEFWKNKASEILVSPFNYKNWSS